MNQAVNRYFTELSTSVGNAWNEFWFRPLDARALAALRIVFGSLAAFMIAAYWPDLDRWFGRDGMLPLDMMRLLYPSQLSLFDYIPPAGLPLAFAATLTAAVLFTLGIGGRYSAVATAVSVLSYVNRAPVVTGEFEAVLIFVLVYLCVGRCCDAYSLADLLRRWRGLPPRSAEVAVSNRVSVRLIQVHLAAACLMMALAQLSAPEGVWWSGEGFWLLASRPDASLIDLSWLAEQQRITSALSHAVTLYLLSFPVLIWPRLLRPLILTAGVVIWTLLLIASGQALLCLAMLGATLAFIEFPAAPSPAIRQE